MDVDFQPLAEHADGVAYAVLGVDNKFMRKDVQNFAIFWKCDVAGSINGAADVFALDVSRPLSKGDAARLFTPRTWPPATPISASSTGTFATLSASSTARRMELT